MSTLGLVALTLAAVVVAIAVALRILPRRARPQRPRTVADLVRMREEAAAVEPAVESVEEKTAEPEAVVEVEPEEAAEVEVDEKPDQPETLQPNKVATPPAGMPVPPAADLAPGPVLSDPADRHVDPPWARAARMAITGGAVWSPDTEPEPAEQPAPAEAEVSPAALCTSRPRRSPAERAAEQAAADLALLRTFGVAASIGRHDTEAVVSLAAAHADHEADGAGAEQPVAFRIVGRDGIGIAGATVTLLDDHGKEGTAAVAGPEGRGELKAPHPGSFVLVSTAADHQPGAVAITVGDGPAEAEVLLARSASLSGSVHGEDGPIVGARLTLVQDGEVVDTVESGVDGTYRVVDLAAGEYGLSVSALDCEPVAALLEIPDETDVRHDVDLDPAGLPAPQHADGVTDLMIGHR